jgi:hypothetical protein
LRERDDFISEQSELRNRRFAKIRERGRFNISTPLSNFLSSAYASLMKFSLSLKGREDT